MFLYNVLDKNMPTASASQGALPTVATHAWMARLKTFQLQSLHERQLEKAGYFRRLLTSATGNILVGLMQIPVYNIASTQLPAKLRMHSAFQVLLDTDTAFTIM